MPQKKIPEDIAALNEKSTAPCVSILVPTHKKSHERMADPASVKKAVARAGRMLEGKYGAAVAGSLLKKIHSLYESIDFVHNGDGIGLFASPAVSKIIHFPFTVKEKVIVGDSFEIRDILDKAQREEKYLVLSLSEKKIQLFEGSGNLLKEITDKRFPKKYTEEYEYSRAARGSSNYVSLKSTEKDKSILKKIRLERFFKEADKELKADLADGKLLVVAAPGKETAAYRGITSHSASIAGTISGNFQNGSAKRLEDAAWDSIRKYRQGQKENEIRQLYEIRGTGKLAQGIPQVWEAVKEGRGLKLVVERGFTKHGFSGDDSLKIYKKPTPGKNSRPLSDVVDDIIENVIRKKGTVLFVADGKLIDFDRIALVMRY